MGQYNSNQIRPPDLNERSSIASQQSYKGKGSSKFENIDIKENKAKTDITIRTFTWHRDSHGLFDYESKNITNNYLRCNYSQVLYRVEHTVIFEELKAMHKVQNPLSIILEKDNNYWIYHKNQVEDQDEEKLLPAEKCWLIVKYITHPQANQRGYKIRIGDTLKFGRVRFKVIMMHNQLEGEQVYQIRSTNQNTNSKSKGKLRDSQENTESDNDDDMPGIEDNDMPEPEGVQMVNNNNNNGLNSHGRNINPALLQNALNLDPNQRSLAVGGGQASGAGSLSNSQRSKRPKKKLSSTSKVNKDKIQRKDTQNSQGPPICRICLGDENVEPNPLISPCKCSGSMKMIHIDCLREWLNSKSSFKENSSVKTYCWKALECELCKMRFPDRIFSEKGPSIELISYDKPESDYIVLESVTQQNIKIIHVIDMDSREQIRVGRGHDSQVRITDISVSRCHALIKKSNKGDYIVEDNNSKFGTLVLVRKPYMLQKMQINYLQLGRTLIELQMRDPVNPSCCNIRTFCIRTKPKAQKGAGLTFDGEDFYPEEFVQRPHEFTREEDQILQNKNKSEKAEAKGLDKNSRSNPNSNNLFVVHTNLYQQQQFEDTHRRGSQALENMTEQLQGNMNAEDDEYGEEEEEELSPDEQLIDNTINNRNNGRGSNRRQRPSASHNQRRRRANDERRSIFDLDGSAEEELNAQNQERLYPMRLAMRDNQNPSQQLPLRVSNFIAAEDQMNGVIDDDLENSQTFLNPSQNLDHLRNNLASMEREMHNRSHQRNQNRERETIDEQNELLFQTQNLKNQVVDVGFDSIRDNEEEYKDQSGISANKSRKSQLSGGEAVLVKSNIVPDVSYKQKQKTIHEKTRNVNMLESIHSNSSGTVNLRMHQHNLQQETKSIKLQHFYQSDIPYDQEESSKNQMQRSKEHTGKKRQSIKRGQSKNNDEEALDLSQADVSSQQILHDQSIYGPPKNNGDKSLLIPVGPNDSPYQQNNHSLEHYNNINMDNMLQGAQNIMYSQSLVQTSLRPSSKVGTMNTQAEINNKVRRSGTQIIPGTISYPEDEQASDRQMTSLNAQLMNYENNENMLDQTANNQNEESIFTDNKKQLKQHPNKTNKDENSYLKMVSNEAQYQFVQQSAVSQSHNSISPRQKQMRQGSLIINQPIDKIDHDEEAQPVEMRNSRSNQNLVDFDRQNQMQTLSGQKRASQALKDLYRDAGLKNQQQQSQRSQVQASLHQSQSAFQSNLQLQGPSQNGITRNDSMNQNQLLTLKHNSLVMEDSQHNNKQSIVKIDNDIVQSSSKRLQLENPNTASKKSIQQTNLLSLGKAQEEMINLNSKDIQMIESFEEVKDDLLEFNEGQILGYNGAPILDNTTEGDKLFSNDTSAINIVPQGSVVDHESKENSPRNEQERNVLIIDNSSNFIDDSADISNIQQREEPDQASSQPRQDIMILQDISSALDNHTPTPQLNLRAQGHSKEEALLIIEQTPEIIDESQE